MMKEMTCLEIAGVCKGKFFGTEEEGKKIIAGIGIDSRKIEKDWVLGPLWEKERMDILLFHRYLRNRRPALSAKGPWKTRQDLTYWWRVHSRH